MVIAVPILAAVVWIYRDDVAGLTGNILTTGMGSTVQPTTQPTRTASPTALAVIAPTSPGRVTPVGSAPTATWTPLPPPPAEEAPTIPAAAATGIAAARVAGTTVAEPVLGPDNRWWVQLGNQWYYLFDYAATPDIVHTPLSMSTSVPGKVDVELGQIVHVVEAGETMSEIAKTYGLVLEDLIAANPGVEPAKLMVGQELVIPNRGDLSAPAAATAQPTEVPTPAPTDTVSLGSVTLPTPVSSDTIAPPTPTSTPVAEPSMVGGGGVIAFVCETRERVYAAVASNVCVVKPDGSGGMQLTQHLSELYSDINSISWSPDGTRIVYSRPQEGPDGWCGDLYIANADGSGYYNLTNTPDSCEENVVWWPGGNLAFSYSTARYGPWARYTMYPDGSGLQWFSDDAPRDPEYQRSSPGGTLRVSMDMDTRTGDVVVSYPDDSGASVVATGASQRLQPAWSPK
ncbi:MAG: LysM peptidoglycan-binding domain-containing protein [Anaerolineae bacterium]